MLASGVAVLAGEIAGAAADLGRLAAGEPAGAPAGAGADAGVFAFEPPPDRVGAALVSARSGCSCPVDWSLDPLALACPGPPPIAAPGVELRNEPLSGTVLTRESPAGAPSSGAPLAATPAVAELGVPASARSGSATGAGADAVIGAAATPVARRLVTGCAALRFVPVACATSVLGTRVLVGGVFATGRVATCVRAVEALEIGRRAVGAPVAGVPSNAGNGLLAGPEPVGAGTEVPAVPVVSATTVVPGTALALTDACAGVEPERAGVEPVCAAVEPECADEPWLVPSLPSLMAAKLVSAVNDRDSLAGGVAAAAAAVVVTAVEA